MPFNLESTCTSTPQELCFLGFQARAHGGQHAFTSHTSFACPGIHFTLLQRAASISNQRSRNDMPSTILPAFRVIWIFNGGTGGIQESQAVLEEITTKKVLTRVGAVSGRTKDKQNTTTITSMRKLGLPRMVSYARVLLQPHQLWNNLNPNAMVIPAKMWFFRGRLPERSPRTNDVRDIRLLVSTLDTGGSEIT